MSLKYSSFAAALRCFRKIVQNGRNEGAQPPCCSPFYCVTEGLFLLRQSRGDTPYTFLNAREK